MKKALILMTFIMAILLVLPVIANAETSKETEINEFVQSKEKICDAKCLVYENNCVLAIKTEKFVGKSEYDNFKEHLQQEIAEKFGLSNIIVTRNPKIFHGVEQLYKMTESEREEAVKKIIAELEKKDHTQIQPR